MTKDQDFRETASMTISCSLFSLPLDAPPLPFQPPQHSGGCAQPKGYPPDMLWSHSQISRKFAVIQLPAIYRSEFSDDGAKMSVQIETPNTGAGYKQTFMNVKKKSELIDPKLRALGARIRAIRQAKGLTQANFAAMFGVTQVAISRWEKGLDRIGPKSLAILAGLTSDSGLREYFERESGLIALSAHDSHVPEDVREINLLRDSVAAGTPRASDEREIAQKWALPKSWFPRGGEIIAVRVCGDSMSPLIHDGYTVFIDLGQRNAKNLEEKMVAAREGEGITIKWLRKDGDVYLLVPQHVSPRHPVRVMRPEGDFSIVGAVVKWIGQPPPIRK